MLIKMCGWPCNLNAALHDLITKKENQPLYVIIRTRYFTRLFNLHACTLQSQNHT